MNTTSIMPMTEGQEKQLSRVVMEDELFTPKPTNDEAQCLLKHGNILQTAVRISRKEIFVKYLYADEEKSSDYTYPKEYKRKSIREQIDILLECFPGLNATWALMKGEAWYDSLKNLPDWIEGPLVYVWWEMFGNYNAATEQVLSALGKKYQNFVNYRNGQLGPEYLQQSKKTTGLEAKIKKDQPGDLIIVPSQAGLRWRGKSVRRGRVLYDQNEFGSGSVAEGCRVLTHNRFVQWEQLHVDCGGDEYAPEADRVFSHAPHLYFLDSEIGFVTYWIDYAHGHFGSASSLLPQ